MSRAYSHLQGHVGWVLHDHTCVYRWVRWTGTDPRYCLRQMYPSYEAHGIDGLEFV